MKADIKTDMNKIEKTNLKVRKKAAVDRISAAAFSLALAAAVAIASTGCSSSAHSSSAPADPTESPAPARTSTGAFPAAVPADSTAQGSTAAADTADTKDTKESAGQSSTASADATSAETASTDRTGPAVPEDADTTADKEVFDIPSDEQENTAAGSTSAASVIESAPARDTADTALLESVLSEALVDCTGWGQSAGSSLRAASAATRLLRWANQAQAGSADTATLKEVAAAEIGRLSSNQKSSIKDNWSFISYDADTILDDIDELKNVLEDAGCLEAAKDAAAYENAHANWKAASEAIEDALR